MFAFIDSFHVASRTHLITVSVNQHGDCEHFSPIHLIESFHVTLRTQLIIVSMHQHGGYNDVSASHLYQLEHVAALWSTFLLPFSNATTWAMACYLLAVFGIEKKKKQIISKT